MGLASLELSAAPANQTPNRGQGALGAVGFVLRRARPLSSAPSATASVMPDDVAEAKALLKAPSVCTVQGWPGQMLLSKERGHGESRAVAGEGKITAPGEAPSHAHGSMQWQAHRATLSPECIGGGGAAAAWRQAQPHLAQFHPTCVTAPMDRWGPGRGGK